MVTSTPDFGMPAGRGLQDSAEESSQAAQGAAGARAAGGTPQAANSGQPTAANVHTIFTAECGNYFRRGFTATFGRPRCCQCSIVFADEQSSSDGVCVSRFVLILATYIYICMYSGGRPWDSCTASRSQGSRERSPGLSTAICYISALRCG